MQGRRRLNVQQDAEGWSGLPEAVQPGDYWKLIRSDGSVEWYACVPSGWLGEVTTVTFAEARCGNPACKTLTEEVCEDSVQTLRCPRCNQFNHIVSRKSISDGRCVRCRGKPLDDHAWAGDQAVCRK